MTEQTNRPKMNAANLGLRFVLEIAAVVAIFAWGLRLADDWWRYLIAGALAVCAVTLWGVFNVTGDPSRSGNAPVRVPGVLRLLVELLVLGGGAACAALAWHVAAGAVFGVLVVLHYAVAWRRVAWLLQQ